MIVFHSALPQLVSSGSVGQIFLDETPFEHF